MLWVSLIKMYAFIIHIGPNNVLNFHMVWFDIFGDIALQPMTSKLVKSIYTNLHLLP